MRIIKLFFFLLPLFSFSQSDSLKIISFNKSDQFFLRNDSSLTGFQNYTSKDNLGNIGLAQVEKEISAKPLSEAQFNYWNNYFSNYLIQNNNLLYFNTNRPYTRLNYIIGSKKEQDFSFLHTQNVNKYLNFSAAFQRIRSEGFYLRQNTNHNSFSFNSNYLSEKKKYQLLSNVIFNSLKNSENGGIASDSSFEKAILRDKKLVPVNLSSAQRKFRNRSFYLEQNLKIDHDTIAQERIYITHSFLIEDNSISYKDENPNQGFYNEILYDSTKTLDSVSYYRIINELGIKRKIREDISFQVLLNNELVRLKQKSPASTNNINSSDTAFNNYSLKLKVRNLNNKNINYQFDGSYILSGSYKGDYHFKAVASKSFTNGYIEASVFQNRLNPFYIFERFNSNNFQWENNFQKTSLSVGSLVYRNEKLLNLGLEVRNYHNILFFDVNGKPAQIQSGSNLFSFSLGKDLKFSRWTFANKIKYQYAPNFSAIRIPEWISSHSIFYQNFIFKKSLLTQIGVDAFYNSSYYADAYIPATGEFYLQNEIKIGNYVFTDFFLDFRIKSVRAFFKVEHFGSGFLGKKYYIAPHYPAADRSFKFGISWVFNN